MSQNFNFPVVADNIDSYICRIEKFNLLSAEEEAILIGKYHQENNIEAAQKLVLSNLRFVVKIANEYKRFGFPLRDLIQEGNLGLMKAVKNFDPAKGCKKFISYAVWWIRAQIHEFIIRSWSLVKIGTTQLQKKLFYKFSNIDKDIDNEGVLTRELAEEFNVTEDKILELKNRLENSDVSLDSKLTDDEGSSFLNFIESDYLSPEDVVIENEKEEILKDKLYIALNVLNTKEKEIISERYLSESPKTLEEIGDQYKITRERVRQIEKKALLKMQKVLDNDLKLLVA